MPKSKEDRDTAASRSFSEAIRRGDFGVVADWFATAFIGVGCAGLLIATVAAWLDTNNFSTGLRVLALGILMAGAFAVCGWLLGLIFGIPRSLARANAPTTAPNTSTPSSVAPTPSSRVNTNLEDVSDWLTKTIIGVGLTQLMQVPGYVHKLTDRLNSEGFGWDKHGAGLALALLFYYLPGGFWLGYVATRTVLTKLFDQFNLSGSDLDKASQINLTESGIVAAPQDVRNIDSALMNVPMQQLNSTQELTAWAAAKARSGDLESARVALENALKADTSNADIRQQLATVYAALKRYADANALLSNTPDTPTSVLAALYELPPAGFQKAIKIAENLLTDPKYARNASLHVWLACAYAQKYGFDKTQGNADLMKDDKARVLSEAKTAIQIDPATRDQLKAFWKPSSPDAIDDDLSFFDPNDPDLTALLSPAG